MFEKERHLCTETLVPYGPHPILLNWTCSGPRLAAHNHPIDSGQFKAIQVAASGGLEESEIESLVKQIVDKDPTPYVTREFSRDILRVCEAAQQSADEGRRVSME